MGNPDSIIAAGLGIANAPVLVGPMAAAITTRGNLDAVDVLVP